MNSLTKINDIVEKYQHQLSIRELIQELSYVIDDIYVDKFWESIESDKWIYIDDQILKWFGYVSTDEYKLKRRYLELLDDFTIDKDYKHINNSEFKILVANDSLLESNVNIDHHNKTKHLLVSPRCFKETLMMLRTAKASSIRNYYLDLEEVFKLYLKYQSAYMRKTIDLTKEELKRMKDGSNHFKSIIINKNILKLTQYVYVATSAKYAARNIFKVGMTVSFKDRIKCYQTGRCEEDEFKYLFIMPCVKARELEQYVFTRLEFFRYSDSNGNLKKEMYQVHYELIVKILTEFQSFEQTSTKTINNYLIDYYDNHENMPMIDLDQEAIVDVEKYIIDKIDPEFQYETLIPKDLTGSCLTNDSINAELEQYGLKIVSPYTGKCEEQQIYECLSIFKHKIVATHSHIIDTKKNGCVHCRKFGILNQVPIYAYKDKTYEFVSEYKSFEDLQEQKPELNHQLLKNIIREERWLTAHQGYVFSILSPHEDKLDLNKSLTEIESKIIEILEIDYKSMRDRILRTKMQYVIAILKATKTIYYGSSMTEMASHIRNVKTKKLVNRKTIAKHVDKNTEYAGYQWIMSNSPSYENYTAIDVVSL